MAIQIIEVMQPFWYTPMSCEGDKTPSQFKMKPLSGIDQAYLAQFAEITESGNVVLGSEGIREYLLRSVIDWKGVNDPKGKKAKFNKELLVKLPYDISLDLINVIRDRSEVSGEELKNS